MQSSSVAKMQRFWRKGKQALCAHVCAQPLAWQKRLVFEFSLLSSDIEMVAPRVPMEFRLLPEHSASIPALPRSAASEGRRQSGYLNKMDVAEWYFYGQCGSDKASWMHICVDYDTVQALLPCCDIPERSAFIYGCETEARYRGRGLYPAALTYVLRYLRQQDFERAYLRVHPYNHASIRGIEKAGFQLCGEVYYVSLFGFALKPRGKARGVLGVDRTARQAQVRV